jgi:hypothetical protein
MSGRRTVVKYLITINPRSAEHWSFRYVGRLTWWQRLCIEMAGWKISEIP